jgi:hypothetical protein
VEALREIRRAHHRDVSTNLVDRAADRGKQAYDFYEAVAGNMPGDLGAVQTKFVGKGGANSEPV